MSTGPARSVQTRLVRHAKALHLDPNLVLSRYATERLLYRLSRSSHADRFVLKGALLLLVWLGETIRPTRDADLLGFGELGADGLPFRITLERDGVLREVKGKETLPLQPGDFVTIKTSGGGAYYGLPTARPPELVERDRQEGYR